ncbi:MAG: ATP-binding protein [Actinobacteria bacterium]|nr:MAG: ATP-binding protein [Actinomycetota bacterium]
MGHEQTVLPVTVDKSHLITIGEQLYAESVELVRELVNNAYDADATRVDVTIEREELRVEDNGSGMDLDGLRQYFTIGSEDKRARGRSRVFGRDLIGQFGIGKFATLSAAGRFEVTTKQGDFAATVLFDKEEWARACEEWSLPMRMESPSVMKHDGTIVRLSELRKTFDPEDVRARLAESVPINAPDFEVYVNGVKVRPPRLSGHRIPFMEGTPFGLVHGEIVVLPTSSASAKNLGIEVKVKQVTVRRELFGMESWGRDAARVRGEAHGDFLTVTTDRSGFITDSEEYRAFREAMEKVMREVRSVLGQLAHKKENRVASRALREALDRIQKALESHPDLSPFGNVPYSDGTPALGEAGVVAEEEAKPPQIQIGEGEAEAPKPKPKPKRKKKSKARQLTPGAVVRRVRIGSTGVTCCLDHFGEDGPESFSEENVIYINRDHPLYVRESKKRETHLLNVSRLLTQEISLMRNPRNPRRAYDHQSVLLRDAFADE